MFTASALIKKKTEQKKMESALGCLVQVNEEGKDITTAVGQMTSIELSISSLPFPLDQLSCKLTDPNSQHVECNITPTQPNMATVSYTPTLRGAHQLKITVGDTDIPGSPFTVVDYPPKMTGVPSPWGVAVSSKSGKGREEILSSIEVIWPTAVVISLPSSLTCTRHPSADSIFFCSVFFLINAEAVNTFFV